jgi:hypothetical protein
LSQLNVSDLTWALASMAADGHQVRPELAAALSTYNRKLIRRLGKYDLNRGRNKVCFHRQADPVQ